MNGNWITAYIGLGSNIGDRQQNLDLAIEMLRQTPLVAVTAVSSYRNTEPVGNVEQPDFLNAVAEIQTELEAQELLKVCNGIEKDLKRERIIHWGPRTIDLDILLYGNMVMKEDALEIPHPRMHERDFVLGPLCEIAPQAVHPIYQKTVTVLYQELKTQEQ